MGEINKALGDKGAPLPMVIGDKTYYLSPLTKKKQAGVEAWLEERALQSVQKFKKQLPAEDYIELLNKTSRDIAAGYYSFGQGEGFRQGISTWDGACHLLLSLLQPNQSEIKFEDAAELLENHPAEVKSAMERVIGEYKQRAGVEDDDSGESRPA